MKWDKMNPEDWELFADDWLKELRAAEPNEEDNLRQTVVLMNFTASADAQWQFILASVAKAESDDELGHIAAGPLEHLLGRHGSEFIERVEQQATQDVKFARAMTGMRKYLMSDEVWLRVEAVRKSVPNPL